MATAITQVDGVAVSVFQRRLKALAAEMSQSVLWTTRSPLQNQAHDFGTGIMDARGGMLEQDEFRALFAFAMPYAVQDVARFFGDDVHPGDVILHNDVFGGNLQLSDAGIVLPIFHEERLIAWASSRGHWSDIGGPVPSSCNPAARDYYQEGLRFPPVKVYDRGVFRYDVWNLVFSNVRLREVTEPDLRAQLGACVVAQRGVEALVREIGPERFEALSAALYDSAEAMMRAEIAAMPDGVYRGEGHFFDPIEKGRIHTVRVTITDDGDELTHDYTGTDPQTDTYCNSPYASSVGGAATVLFMLVDPEMPHNEGVLRPVHMIFPEGSLLNPRPPAATFYGNFMTVQHADAIMSALADAMPERVTAGWGRPMAPRVTGWDPRRNRAYHDIMFLLHKGGGGAGHGHDGHHNIAPIFGVSTMTQDYEMHELQNPHFLLQHEYATDTCGPGRWRGGAGIEARCRVDGERVTTVIQSEVGRAYGAFGGKPGGQNRFEIHYPDGSSYVPSAKESIPGVLPPGSVFHQISGGGGGFGDPHERPAEEVLRDVRDGLVSIQSAWEDYGVAIAPGLTIDRTATARRRGEREHGGAVE
jgi:N-methylhydantoinase B